eukprot:s5314_g1.t3
MKRPSIGKERIWPSQTVVIYGIDFSGAADAGKKMFVAKCALLKKPRDLTLLVHSVLPARQLPGGGLSPQEATAAVRSELLAATKDQVTVVVGVDSPPAIAKEFMTGNWTTWARQFSKVYQTPEAFREATSVFDGSKRREPKRWTDVEHKTPLPPQNLRMYKQTWWAIKGIFAPLSQQGFCVVPCMDFSGSHVLMESCPASVLKRLELYTEPYKGKTAKHGQRRRVILDHLKIGVPIGRNSKTLLSVQMADPKLLPALVADSGADALDAVLAALGAACSISREDFPVPEDGKMLDIYKLEACAKTRYESYVRDQLDDISSGLLVRLKVERILQNFEANPRNSKAQAGLLTGCKLYSCVLCRCCSMDVSGKAFGRVPYGTLLLATTMLLAHGLEGVLGCRKWCSEHLDFTGDALLHGKLWVMFSSSFLHGTHSHFLREAFLMILAGVPLEVFCGGLPDLRSCRLQLQLAHFAMDLEAEPGLQPDATRTLLAVLLVGDQGLAQFFGISPETANGLLLAARFIPEIFSPLSTRLRSYPLVFGSVFLVMLLVAFSLPAELTVSNSLLFWFFVHCFFRAYPSLLALGPPREFAATDYLGHIYGALAAVLLGGWQLFRRLTVMGSPHLQSWLALTVLCISTLP